LFYNSPPCAKNFFKYDHTKNLKLDQNEIVSNSNDEYKYFKLNVADKSPTIHTLTIKIDAESSVFAYDYQNCKGRKQITEKPDLNNNCGYYKDVRIIDFTLALEKDNKGPVNISLKFKGKATIKITPIYPIELVGKGGVIKNEMEYYQNYSYKAITPGYVFVEISLRIKDKEAKLYHDTEGCKDSVTNYPRFAKHCLRKTSKNHVQLVIPNESFNRYHYFGLSFRQLETVQFTYELFSITDISEGKKEFKFNNALAMPFKFSAKKGSHNITITVTNDTVNKCNIYLDYSGCRWGFALMPNIHNNCLLTTNRTPKTCSLSFELDQDADVYFGVETIISESMTVEITTGEKKLAFLD
jgi:hypothetical protein